MADVSLSRMTHDVVQNTYKDMHALLDSLGDLAPEARRTKLLDFVLKMRHRFARLLVAVRWFMSYSAFHGSAQATRQLASQRSAALMQNADTLHAVSGYVRNASLSSSAVQEAAEILGASAFFARIPRIIENAVGLDLSADVNELDASQSNFAGSESHVNAEAVERLGVVTRYVVTSSLPAGVEVIDTNVGPKNAAIRIGVRDSWTADVILDSLKPEEALLRLVHYDILVDAHPDALGDMYTRWRSKEAPVALKELREPLHEMIQDRMKWVATATKAANDSANLQKKVLLTLCKMMTYECAGRFAMEHIRSQALALTSYGVWKQAGLVLTGVGSQAADDIPVRIQYWQKSHIRGALSIRMKDEKDFEGWGGNVLHVQHEGTPLSKNLPSAVQMNGINVEELFVSTCKMRASLDLHRLKRLCSQDLSSNSKMEVVEQGGSSNCLMVSLDGHAECLSFGISLPSGGLNVRTHRTLSLALSGTSTYAEDVQRNLWKGDRFFPKGPVAIKGVILNLITRVEALIQDHTAAKCACAIDGGVNPRWPPGRAYVEAPEKTQSGEHVKPPFMPIDKKRPRRFLTMLSVASENDKVYVPAGSSASKRVRSLPLPCSVSSDRTLFIRGRRAEGFERPHWCHDLHCAATNMADWAEIRHTVETRLRRDQILQWLEENKLGTAVDGDYALRSSHYTPLNMRAPPLEIQKSALVLFNGEGWKIELTLNDDIFDTDNLSGQVVSYSSDRRLLTFTYPNVSAETLKAFTRDCIRARTTAAVLQGLPGESKIFEILQRSPSCVEVRAHGITLTIGTGRSGVQLEALPQSKLISNQLIPLMEEVMNESGKNMGLTLSALLELSIPLALALQVAKPNEQAMFQVRFMGALQARLFMASSPKQPPYAIDVEVRGGFNGVVLKDLHRYLTMKKSSRAHQFKPIPIWKALADKLESNKLGKSVYEGAAILIRLSELRRVVLAIAAGVQKKG